MRLPIISQIAVRRASSALVAVALALAATPAFAETVYLKNGTQVQGKIVKEDATSFSIEAGTTRRRVLKSEIEQLAPADPTTAFLLGLVVAGGGDIYVGQYDRAGLFFALGIGAGAVGYFATRQIHPSSQSAAVVAGVLAYYFPAIVGCFDAVGAAQRLSAVPRYHVDYGTP